MLGDFILVILLTLSLCITVYCVLWYTHTHTGPGCTQLEHIFVQEVDGKSNGMAAGMAKMFTNWRRLDPGRQEQPLTRLSNSAAAPINL